MACSWAARAVRSAWMRRVRSNASSASRASWSSWLSSVGPNSGTVEGTTTCSHRSPRARSTLERLPSSVTSSSSAARTVPSSSWTTTRSAPSSRRTPGTSTPATSAGDWAVIRSRAASNRRRSSSRLHAARSEDGGANPTRKSSPRTAVRALVATCASAPSPARLPPGITIARPAAATASTCSRRRTTPERPSEARTSSHAARRANSAHAASTKSRYARTSRSRLSQDSIWSIRGTTSVEATTTSPTASAASRSSRGVPATLEAKRNSMYGTASRARTSIRTTVPGSSVATSSGKVTTITAATTRKVAASHADASDRCRSHRRTAATAASSIATELSTCTTSRTATSPPAVGPGRPVSSTTLGHDRGHRVVGRK